MAIIEPDSAGAQQGVSSLSGPSGWVFLGGSLVPQPLFALRHFLVLLILIAGLGAVYLWQAEELSGLHDITVELQLQAAELDASNADLARQLAQWISPAYVDRMSEK